PDVTDTHGDCPLQTIGRVTCTSKRNGERISVEQCHVRALAELGAGGMPGVADVDQPAVDRLADGAMRIMGEGQLVRVRELVEQWRRLGPQFEHLLFPGRQAPAMPLRLVPDPQGPEECRLLPRTGLGLAYRHYA